VSTGRGALGTVGRLAERLGSPRGWAAVETEFVFVAIRFGTELAALERMLLKNVS